MSNCIDPTNKSAFLYATAMQDGVIKICAPLFENFGIKHFHYGFIYQDCSYLMLSTSQHLLLKYFDTIHDQGKFFSKALQTVYEDKFSYFLWPTNTMTDSVIFSV